VCVCVRLCASACNDRVRVHGFVCLCSSVCVVNGRVFVRAFVCLRACVRPRTRAFVSECALCPCISTRLHLLCACVRPTCVCLCSERVCAPSRGCVRPCARVRARVPL
jgi:hypothetical protein